MIVFRLFQRYGLWCLFALALLLHQFPTANKFDYLNHLSPFVGALGLSAFVAVSGFFLWKKKVGLSKGPLFFLLAFLSWFALAFGMAEVRTFAFSELFVLLGLIPVFLLFAGEEELENTLPTAMTVLLLVHAIWGIDTFLTTSHQRFFGLFYDPAFKPNAWPNAYAVFVMASFPWMLMRFYLQGQKGVLLKDILVGLVLGGFFMTLSRAGYIAFLGEMTLFVGFLWRDKTWIRPAPLRFVAHGLCVLAVAAVLVFFLQDAKIRQGEFTDLSDRFTFVETQGSVSFSERAEFFEGTIELIKEKPLFGFGAVSFRSIYPKVQQSFLAISDHSHNLFLKWGLEEGLPVVFFFLGFLLLLFMGSNPLAKTTSLFQRVAWSALLGMLAHSLVDYNFNFFSNALLFWLLLAAVVHPKKLNTFWLWVQRVLVGLLFIMVLVFSAVLRLNENRFDSLMEGTSSMEEAVSFQPILPRWEFLQLADRYEADSVMREYFLKRQLAVDPYSAEAVYKLGLLAETHGEVESALAYYKEAMALRPEGTFLYLWSYVHLAEIAERDDLLQEIRPTVESDIEEYLPMYEINLHYTQALGEIEFVHKLQESLDLE